VRRARQPVGKYNINKRQSDFSGQKFQWKKFWKKNSGIGQPRIFLMDGQLEALFGQSRKVKRTWAMWKWPFGNAA
jgi:hypothetical protein